MAIKCVKTNCESHERPSCLIYVLLHVLRDYLSMSSLPLMYVIFFQAIPLKHAQNFAAYTFPSLFCITVLFLICVVFFISVSN